MKKFVNVPGQMVSEGLQGFASAHADLVVLDEAGRFVRRRAPRRDKVAVISGGGSGHEPLHVGFVGEGMLDAACPGKLFTSPTPDQIVAATKAVASEAGVLYLVKNYDGDLMNFEIARETIGTEIDIALVVVSDEATSVADAQRRGLAGTLIVEKILGAAAEAGESMPQLQALAASVNARTRTMGAALKSCTLPNTDRPNFSLATDEVELGVGIHGEAGRRRTKWTTVGDLTDEIVHTIINELPKSVGHDVVLFVNGLGGTPLIELYLVYSAARARLERTGLRVVRSLVGSYVTCLDMAGCSITVSLVDETLLRYWDAPVRTPVLRW
jgi:phosphoenolpyruvate---glycerone phosphotransferase subunit DhaK